MTWTELLLQTRCILGGLATARDSPNLLLVEGLFAELLLAHKQRYQRPLTGDLAVGLALAVVAVWSQWQSPPPKELVEDLLRRFHAMANRNPLHTNLRHACRAGQFVAAYLLGWERLDPYRRNTPEHEQRFAQEPQDDSWEGRPSGLWPKIEAHVRRQVRQSLTDVVQRGTLSDCRTLNRNHLEAVQTKVSSWFFEYHDRCQCWRRGHFHCWDCHNIDGWSPAHMDLRDFILQALHGQGGGGFFVEPAFAGSMIAEALRT